jgi:hypothetical protein
MYVNAPRADVRGQTPWPPSYAPNLWMALPAVNTNVDLFKGRIIPEMTIQDFKIASQGIVDLLTNRSG